MRLIICYTPYCVSGDHRCGVYVRNDGRANVSRNSATCAYAQYLDGRDMVDGKVQQTVHSRTGCAASERSYNHTGYSRVSCNTVHSSQYCVRVHVHDCVHVRVHGHSVGQGVSNPNECSS